MKDTILARVEKLESLTPVQDRFAGMSYDEKQEIIRAYYSKMFDFEATLTKQEYEDDLLKRYPEVFGMVSEPSRTAGNKETKDMTDGDRHEAIEAYLRRDAWQIAFSRRLLAHQNAK